MTFTSFTYNTTKSNFVMNEISYANSMIYEINTIYTKTYIIYIVPGLIKNNIVAEF